MKFSDLIAAVGESPDGLPESFLTDASSAYDEDMGVYSGKIEVLEAQLAELTVENAQLKAHNYDLIMAQPQAEIDDAEDVDDDGGDGDDTLTPDNLFDDENED